LKELINSGGEKVSPAEVDAAFMQHPAVRQAVTFGVKCDVRGERVYTAVVLEGAATNPISKRSPGNGWPLSRRLQRC
jgi:Acyl-CoA synthetases (AMP-forming)/AMP-acid ligases II